MGITAVFSTTNISQCTETMLVVEVWYPHSPLGGQDFKGSPGRGEQMPVSVCGTFAGQPGRPVEEA